MRLSLTGLLLISAVMLAGCGPDNANGKQTAGNGSTSSSVSGVLASLRPKVDPSMVEKIHQEEALARQRAQQAAMQQMQQNPQQGGLMNISALTRGLPRVSMDPISAPPAEDINRD